MLISVVVPCWRDQSALEDLLTRLGGLPDLQWIPAVAEPAPGALAALIRLGAEPVGCARPSRGAQMNQGAARARGEALLFHHADSWLTAAHLEALRAALDPGGDTPPAAAAAVVGGAFYRKFDERHPHLRWAESVERWHCRAFGTLYGDQSVFVRTAVFRRLGGFADLPLMEDVEFSRRLRRAGRVRLLDPPMASSPRKHLREGRWRTTGRNAALIGAFHLGVSPARLHRLYYRPDHHPGRSAGEARARPAASADQGDGDGASGQPRTETGAGGGRTWVQAGRLCLETIPPPTAPRRRAWIDTDPATGLFGRDADDGFALVGAFNSPELDLRGVSASYGNVALPRACEIARAITGRFGARAGLDGGRVFAGAAGPAALGRETPACRALTEELERGGPLLYVALAPLTNLATVLRRRPELAARLEDVVFVGGIRPGTRLRAGSWNPYCFHDANVTKDPAAVAVVLASDAPLTLVPPELALLHPLPPWVLRALRERGDEAGTYLARAGAGWMRLWRLAGGAPGAMLFDSFAVAVAATPRLFRFEPRRAALTPTRQWPGTPAAGPARRPPSHLVARAAADEASSPAAGRPVRFTAEALPGALAEVSRRLFGPAGAQDGGAGEAG